MTALSATSAMAGRSFLNMLLAVLAIFFFFFPLVTAAPYSSYRSITFKNNCAYDLHFWTVKPMIHTPDSEGSTVRAYSTHVESLIPDTSICLKIRDLDHYEHAPAGIIQAEYKLETAGQLWYDLSYINCNQTAGADDPMYCPFAWGGVTMRTKRKKESCKVAHCQLPVSGSASNCNNTYLIEGGYHDEPSLACGNEHDLVVETCVDGVGDQSWDGSKSPSPTVPVEEEPEQEEPEPEQPEWEYPSDETRVPTYIPVVPVSTPTKCWGNWC